MKNEMKNDTRQVYVDNEMWSELREFDKKPQPKKQYKKQNRTGNDYLIFLPTRGIVMSEKYREIFNDKTTIYYYLLSNIIRGEMRNDKYSIYNKYYQQHSRLACSFPIRHIAKECNVTRYRAHKYLKELKDAGAIEIDTVLGDNGHTANIYVLGTYTYIEGKVRERLFLSDQLEA